MKRYYNLFQIKSNETHLEINRKLNQDISFLHGLKLIDFMMEVPADVNELIETSQDMHHYMYRYVDLILSKKYQIVNLIKDGKRHYTVVVKICQNKISIVEFKGRYNDDSWETSDEGFSYQVEL